MRLPALLALVVAVLACGSEPSPPGPGPDAAVPCGGACGAGTVCEGGRCVAVTPDASTVADVLEDAAPMPDGDASPCAPGWGQCSPGVCVDLATTAAHCGACGAACSPSWRCERGTCVSPSGATCDPGRADCDRNEGNGCEAQLHADHRNCGMCGADCTARGLWCREGVCAR